MPGYVQQALARFGVTLKAHSTDSPILYVPPKYGARIQQLAPVDDTEPLSAADTKFVQQVVGVMAYYSRAVDSTMILAVNKIGSKQATPTRAVLADVHRLLQYAGNHPDAAIVYHASDMIYMLHTDASYLSETRGRSRAGGFHFLSDRSANGTVRVNGAIDSISTIISSVVGSAFEAEYGAMYINATTAEGIRNTLADLDYPQAATAITSDNSVAVSVANKTVKQRRSKAIDMKFHWIQDRVEQGHFTVGWQPGKTNLADYFTKAHPVHHFKSMRPYFVHSIGDSPTRPNARLRRTGRRTAAHPLVDLEGVLEDPF
jgi:hypothetical protein